MGLLRVKFCKPWIVIIIRNALNAVAVKLQSAPLVCRDSILFEEVFFFIFFSKPFSIDFYVESGQPYCVGCYGKTFSKTCGHCNKPILDKCLTAMGKSWRKKKEKKGNFNV